MNRQTGRSLAAQAHIAQSIGDILTTPLGSRVMRREYGSLVPNLIDQPFNARTKLLAFAAIAAAVMRWEPRIRISRVQIFQGERPGMATVELEATRVDTNEVLNLQVPLKMGAFA